MTFSGHVALAGLSLKYIKNPWLVLALNLTLHPVLDAIPHAEWHTFNQGRSRAAIVITAADLLVTAWLVHRIFALVEAPYWLIVTTILASLWLDILDPLCRDFVPQLRAFHVWCHSWPQPPVDPIDWSETLTGQTPVWVKLAIQTTLVAIPYWLIKRL